MFILLTLSACTAVLLYRYLTHHFDYWAKQNVKGPLPAVLFGNMKDVFLCKRAIGKVAADAYEDYPDEKCVGMFLGRTPLLVPRDLDYVKRILLNDFNYFANRGFAVSNDELGDNLFNSDEGVWRVLRQRLTPVFSSGKLKNMFYLMSLCADNFKNHIQEAVDEKKETEMTVLTRKYTMEVICSCAFGIDISELDKDSNPFLEIGNAIFEPTIKEFALRALDRIFPGALKLLNISIANPKVVKFFHDLVKEVVAEREGKPKVRQDFMDLILTLREQGNITGGKFNNENDLSLDITNTIMAAQAFIFFAAGYETSSTTMAFLLYELAHHTEIQDKVRKEINEISAKHGAITYEALQEMHFLGMALAESMRKYPIGYSLHRQCVQKYELPGTQITIDKGTVVVIPVMALHRDPQHYPDPEKFDPERFSPENVRTRHPAAYLAFGDGPRNCIGQRFGKVQSMLGVATILQRWRVLPARGAASPLRFHPTTFTLQSLDGVHVNITNL